MRPLCGRRVAIRYYFSLGLIRVCEIITIHNGCSCRIEISHRKGRNLKQRVLPSPWLNSGPEGEISLPYIDRLMMDCFSVIFLNFLLKI